jgi:hypothetical protein
VGASDWTLETPTGLANRETVSLGRRMIFFQVYGAVSNAATLVRPISLVA